MKLSEVAACLGAQFLGPEIEFESVSIDTRSLQRGALFLALKGENYDAHQFLTEAKAKGAVAAITSKPHPDATFPTLVVKNTLDALRTLAARHREKMQATLIAITGSCGKTTTKTLLANILSQQAPTLATIGTLNNHIGVPLTLLQLRKEHRFAVIEMGANHLGEVASYVEIAKPNASLVTMVAPVHLEGFGSLENIAQGKGEIYTSLPTNGQLIINRDDPFADYWAKEANNRSVYYFGYHKQADVTASNVRLKKDGTSTFILKTPKDQIKIQLPLLGKHNVTNALAASCAAYMLNIPIEMIKEGLMTSKAVEKRLNQYPGLESSCIIDDTYNANPVAAKAALNLLAKRNGQRIFVLGDMLELGKNAPDYHNEIGHFASALNIDAVYTYGELAQYTSQAFGKTGRHFKNKATLINELRDQLNETTTVLVKGSKSMKMWEVVIALQGEV